LEFLVPLLQSVFCLQGYDDRSRFFALSGTALLAFMLFSAIFSSYFVINVLFLFLLTTIVTLTTIRRLRDAKLNKNWQFVPSIVFFVTGVVTLLLSNNVSYYLLLIPALCSALLLTYPSKSNKRNNKYIYGYYGPIDLSSYKQGSLNTMSHSQRIEPTLASEGVNSHSMSYDPMATQVTQDNNNQIEQQTTNQDEADIGELIRLKLLTNKKLQLALIVAVSVIIVITFITSLLTKDVDNTQTQDVNTELTKGQMLRQGKNEITELIAGKTQYLAMPDNFDLYLTPHRGILLHWQADEVSNGQLWSQLSTNGDNSCQVINFNKGNDFRPLTVEVENNTEYFASFSPLDTQALIRALAFRGNFSLCGYDFSLKGSQTALGKHDSYAGFLEK